MDINEYIADRYDNSSTWFESEVDLPEHISRISDVVNYKYYLQGQHKVLEREDFEYKGKKYETRKIIIQQAKTILNFHSTYLLGKPLSLVGSENKVKEYQNIYRKGHYNNVDFKLLDNVGKYGDSYEYIYLDSNKNIVSKIIASEDGYPVYSEDDGEYIAFIEYYTKISNSVSYYNIYYPDHVEQWSNKGAELHLIKDSINLSGLPIHFHSLCDWNNEFGVSLLYDLISIFDEYEDIFSKLGDSIYTLSLNPIPTISGQQWDSDESISADATGFIISLPNGGEMKYVNAQMDYNNIKLYLDKIQQNLNQVAYMPSVAMGNSNVANVSEVSLKLLYQLADIYAILSEKWFRGGLQKRFDIFDKLLVLKGISFKDDEYVDAEFSYSRPVNNQEQLQNIKIQHDMGAISTRTVIEKSPITTDVNQEMERIQKDKKKQQDNNVVNDSNNINDNGNLNNNNMNM